MATTPSVWPSPLAPETPSPPGVWVSSFFPILSPLYLHSSLSSISHYFEWQWHINGERIGSAGMPLLLGMPFCVSSGSVGMLVYYIPLLEVSLEAFTQRIQNRFVCVSLLERITVAGRFAYWCYLFRVSKLYNSDSEWTKLRMAENIDLTKKWPLKKLEKANKTEIF